MGRGPTPWEAVWSGAHHKHSPGGLGVLVSSLQALWWRSRASVAATGARRPRPKPRPRTADSSGAARRQGLLGGVRLVGTHQAQRKSLLPSSPPIPLPFWGAERVLLGQDQVPLPLGVSVWGMDGPCEALDQEVVGLAVVDWTGGPWVSHGGVAGGLLSSQMASELLLAARSVRFPNKVQLRGPRVLIRPESPSSSPVSGMGTELRQYQGDVGSNSGPHWSLRQHQSPGQRQQGEEPWTLPGPPALTLLPPAPSSPKPLPTLPA